MIRQNFSMILLLTVMAICPLRSAEVVAPAAKSVVFTGEHLGQYLAEALAVEYPREKGVFKVSLLRPFTDLHIPDGVSELVLATPPATGLRSRLMLRYTLSVNGELIQTASVPVEIQILREVLVSSRRLNRGQQVTLDDLSLEIRDVLSENAMPLDPAADVSIYEVHYTLLRGHILTERHVRLMPVVKRGDLVTAYLRRGLLQINLKVEVMEEAAPGQTVRLRNLESKKPLRGVVYDENSVFIQ
ncbi:MAG: flagellar basal body P-ring formation chaperone FlgA [Verrucomicrobiota bacterium]|jgi:flagellar basal body P-ring formation protein FlgA|nr:flagellar basal body P-ring formation chaperone FlgA [Verrucomicrobiota bacterium]